MQTVYEYHLRCPKCFQDDDLMVFCTVGVQIYEYGHETPESGSIWWDETNDIVCSCDHEGKVADFKIDPTEDARLAKEQGDGEEYTEANDNNQAKS